MNSSPSCFGLLLLLLFFVLVALGITGCATTQSDSLSERPWNSPQGWETGGLPSSMNEGR